MIRVFEDYFVDSSLLLLRVGSTGCTQHLGSWWCLLVPRILHIVLAYGFGFCLGFALMSRLLVASSLCLFLLVFFVVFWVRVPCLPACLHPFVTTWWFDWNNWRAVGLFSTEQYVPAPWFPSFVAKESFGCTGKLSVPMRQKWSLLLFTVYIWGLFVESMGHMQLKGSWSFFL